MQAAAASPEKWQSLKNDFPEWSEAVESFVDSRLAGAVPKAQDPAVVDQLVDKKLAEYVPSLRRELSEELLESEFSGWKDDVKKPEFVEWVNAQNDDMKRLVNSDRLSDAAKLLRAYKQSATDPGAAIQDARQKRLEAATALPKGAHVPQAKQPEDMTVAELWAYEAEQASKRRTARGY